MSNIKLNIGKIVGTATKKSWSQTHVFLPKNPKKRKKYGNLLICFSLKALKDEVDIALYGKEIVSHFHEIYYSSEEKGILRKIKKSFQLLTDEFKTRVELEAVCGVVIKHPVKGRLGYFATSGKAGVFILRQNQLVKILKPKKKEVSRASGFLKKDDLVVLGTSQFFKTLGLKALKTALIEDELAAAVEQVSALIQAQEKNSQTASIIFKLKPVKQKKGLKLSKTSVSSKLKKTGLVFKAVFQSIKQFKKEKPFSLKSDKTLSIRIRDESKRLKAKKTTLSVAIILIGLLIISVVLGLRKKTTSQQVEIVESVLTQAANKYEQAVSLNELNPLRAKTLLKEAKDLVDANINNIESKQEKKKLEELLEKLISQLEAIAKEYKIEQAEIFLDLSLAKENFKGSSWAVEETEVFIFDNDKKTILKVDIGAKSFEVVGGGSKLAESKHIAAAPGRVFSLTNSKIFVIDVGKGEVIDEVEAEDWGKIATMVGFSSNIYLLDTEKNMILKYRGINTGLSSKSNYLNKEDEDLNSAITMAIDGSVWLLNTSGEILKYTRGVQDHFVVTGIDKAFDEAVKLYTDENLDNLYILDNKNTRVLVINKETGEYHSQYVWSGISGVSDMAAFEEERKILLLVNQRIYEIGIKE